MATGCCGAAEPAAPAPRRQRALRGGSEWHRERPRPAPWRARHTRTARVMAAALKAPRRGTPARRGGQPGPAGWGRQRGGPGAERRLRREAHPGSAYLLGSRGQRRGRYGRARICRRHTAREQRSELSSWLEVLGASLWTFLLLLTSGVLEVTERKQIPSCWRMQYQAEEILYKLRSRSRPMLADW